MVGQESQEAIRGRTSRIGLVYRQTNGTEGRNGKVMESFSKGYSGNILIILMILLFCILDLSFFLSKAKHQFTNKSLKRSSILSPIYLLGCGIF